MARITIEITDCDDGQVEARLLIDARLPEDRNEWTPAQRLAFLIRDAIHGDPELVADIKRIYQEANDE